MNRSFRAAESGRMGSLRIKDGKDEDLALFREMRRREKERDDLLLLQSSDEFDAPLGPKSGSSPIFNLSSGAPAPARRPASDDFLNSENDKNDYDWLLTPPGTPLFPSLEIDSRKTVMSQLGTTPKARPAALKSRLANLHPEPPSRGSLSSSSRQPSSSIGLNTSSSGLRRPSSSGGPGSRPITPTGRPSSNSTSRSLSTSSNKPTFPGATKPTISNSSSRVTLTPQTSTKPSRSSTPTSRQTSTSSKPTPPPRSSTPTSRSSARPSTPTSRPSMPSSSKPTSRASTPTRRPAPLSSTAVLTKSSSSLKSPTTMAKNPVPSRPSSPSVRPRPWKPSEMPGYSLDAPPNLRTSLADRPPSVTRGRPGPPSSRSSSIEPPSNGRTRRQSCSPARGRPPNGLIHASGSSVPVHAVNRFHAKANEGISPVLVGTKMVERVINMRKLAPPRQDDKHSSPHGNLSVKSSSSPDSSGFGRTLSKKSLDMAIRHMGIRQTVPGNLRPLMTNIPASSMYSVRSVGATNRSRTVSVSDSPLATSSNASSSEVNSALYYVNGHELDDDVSSDKGIRSPASLHAKLLRNETMAKLNVDRQPSISILLFLLTVSIASQSDAASPRWLRRPELVGGKFLTREEHWFNQTLDHFSPYDHRQFGQRYYEYLDEFRAPDGPIFLKISGESVCSGISNDYISVLAKKFGAAIVSLEHRYYGKSRPFKSSTTENLRYLSSKQAIFDLATFRQFYQNSLNAKLNRSNVENPWFVFGISYAGALSAWFRLKFPHLTCGSLASSAVVKAVYEFTEFDRQVGESAGPECKSILQEITRLVDQRIESDEKALKALFGASELTNDGDFLYFLADAAVTAFQYGEPDKLCVPLIEAKKAEADLVEVYATYVKDYYVRSLGTSVETYDQKHLKKTELVGGSSDRLWWFQVCTEVAYFQVAPANDSVRSSRVDTQYHLDLCKNVFGEGVYPDVTATNIYYGGTKIAGSKIIFTNGSQDPWRHASKQTSSPEMPSYVVTCHNCGHGTDLRGCPQSHLVIEGDAKNCSSPEAVNKVRQQIISHVDLWLSQCRDSGMRSAI